MNEVTFVIESRVGVLNEHATGWTKEVNKVSWNGNPAKWDIRDWSPSHEQMGRGLTLTDQEMKQMINLVRSWL